MADELSWISPYGGLGDALMLAGVLKQVTEHFPGRRFHLITRTKYPPFFTGHPAIARIGHPPADATVIRTDYWSTPEYRSGSWRGYQVLARIFGLPTPVKETLYVPWEFQDDPLLVAQLPTGRYRVAIAPSTDSVRKQWPAEQWAQLVAKLKTEGIAVFQLGRRTDPYIRGASSFLGMTSPQQAVNLLRHADLVVAQDSFFMHAAHLLAIPAVVLWGGTRARTYGYVTQHHLEPIRTCETPQGCVEAGGVYHELCPHGEAFCMKAIAVDAVFDRVMDPLK